MALTVLSVAYPFAPVTRDPVGGAERVLACLDEALVGRGQRSIVIACRGSRVAGTLIEVPGGDRGRIDEASRALAHAGLRRLIAEVRARERVDVVHLHGLDFAEYLPAPGVPVVATLHLPARLYPHEALHPGRADTWLVPVSRHQARELAGDPEPSALAAEARAAEAARTAVLPPIGNGVEMPRRHPHARRRFVLALGRVCPEKGFHEALDAAALARRPMLLAGEVFAYAEHERYFREEIAPRLDGSRRWIGPVGGQRKQRLLAAAHCVLVPSRIEETSSLVTMEALAAGTPVVAFGTGALPEIIDEEATGFLVDDPAGMARAIEMAGAIDPERCRQAARERFPLGRMVDAYMALYDRLARASRGADSP